MAKRGHPMEQSNPLDSAEQKRLLTAVQTQLSTFYAAHPELWKKLLTHQSNNQ